MLERKTNLVNLPFVCILSQSKLSCFSIMKTSVDPRLSKNFRAVSHDKMSGNTESCPIHPEKRAWALTNWSLVGSSNRIRSGYKWLKWVCSIRWLMEKVEQTTWCWAPDQNAPGHLPLEVLSNSVTFSNLIMTFLCTRCPDCVAPVFSLPRGSLCKLSTANVDNTSCAQMLETRIITAPLCLWWLQLSLCAAMSHIKNLLTYILWRTDRKR